MILIAFGIGNDWNQTKLSTIAIPYTVFGSRSIVIVIDWVSIHILLVPKSLALGYSYSIVLWFQNPSSFDSKTLSLWKHMLLIVLFWDSSMKSLSLFLFGVNMSMFIDHFHVDVSWLLIDLLSLFGYKPVYLVSSLFSYLSSFIPRVLM